MNRNLHDIDKLFKEGIEGKEEETDDRVWGLLERELDKIDLLNTQRKYRNLKRIAAAVLLLLTLSVSALFWQEKTKEGGAYKNSNNAVNVNTNSTEKSVHENNKEIDASSNQDKDSKAVEAEVKSDNFSRARSNLKSSKENSENKISNPTISKNINTTASSSLKTIKKRTAERLSNINNTASFKKNIETTESNGQRNSETVQQVFNKNKNYNSSLAENIESTQTASSVINTVPVQKNTLNGTDKTTQYNRLVNQSESTEYLSKKSFARTVGILDKLGTINSSGPLLPDYATSHSNIVKLKRKFKPYLSTTIFYSPETISNQTRDGYREHHEDDCESIKNGEQVKSSSSIGILVSMKISPRIAVFSGISSSKTESKILPRLLFARPERERSGQSGNGQLKYKINCTSGYAYISSKTSSTAPTYGDSLQGLSSTNKISYTSIPIGVKYFVAGGKLSISAISGFNFNFLTSNSLQVNFVELTGSKSQSQVPIRGLRTMYLSGIFGASVDYKLSHNLSLGVMPVSNFGIGNINKETPAETRRNAFGIRTGLTYKF